MNNQLLQEGDVFCLAKGMQAYVSMPQRFVYANRILSDEAAETNIKVGEVRKTRTKDIEQEIRKIVDESCRKAPRLNSDAMYKLIRKSYKGRLRGETFKTDQFVGEYVVIHTEVSGGGNQGTPSGSEHYPDGHLVKAKKLLTDGTFDEEGIEISFYQSGSFTAMNPSVPVVRKMKAEYA